MPLRFQMTLCEGLLMELPHWLMVVGALSLVFGLLAEKLASGVQAQQSGQRR
jgi:hypothetical protein